MFGVTTAFFGEDVRINPFIGAGAAGLRAIDDFNSDHYDHAKEGFVGGALIYAGGTGGRPIEQMLLPQPFRDGVVPGRPPFASTTATRPRSRSWEL